MRYRKNPRFDLKKSYPLYLEVGLIVALLVIIGAVKIQLIDEAPSPPPEIEQQVLEMEEIVQTQQQETPPPPLRPQVPVEVPNDEIIEDDIIEFDSEFDLDGPMELPPPPIDDEEEEDEEIFTLVEDYPEPIGGMGTIYEKIKYPELARRAGVDGRVILQFTVTKKGDVEDVVVLHGFNELCEQEAIRAVKATKFKPGKQRGRPVIVRFQIPITFRLDN
ncbi:MAG: energy transducer TonB [Balneolaceae bacterium]|nr:energy transducer TonB [Balneolaceae bacterium]